MLVEPEQAVLVAGQPQRRTPTQVFFFVNKWHDHLADSPIGFTEAAGNFQRVNRTQHGKGGDAVRTQNDDGANTDRRSAGQRPRRQRQHGDAARRPRPAMQMYLQHQPCTTYPDGDPFSPTNVGDEADTVYHEYTHGLSNRLVVDAAGRSTLGDVQAGAMGEAWSDWYAMDYLVDAGCRRTGRSQVDVVLFQYDGEGVFLDRTEPIDCTVGATSVALHRRCDRSRRRLHVRRLRPGRRLPGGARRRRDLGPDAVGPPRRARLGEVSESLVTRAMELSPANPSFLDERNAILLADMAVYGGRHQDAIWRVFAHRGMGYFAGALGGNDATPGADFHMPPANPAKASITGTVTDQDSGTPVSGATVTLAFQGGGPVNPAAATAANGTYSSDRCRWAPIRSCWSPVPASTRRPTR